MPSILTNNLTASKCLSPYFFYIESVSQVLWGKWSEQHGVIKLAEHIIVLKNAGTGPGRSAAQMCILHFAATDAGWVRAGFAQILAGQGIFSPTQVL
eukprot:CAMPEP_0174284108 /NCGR_PEP_ID=MMETSP0809-20121228/4849_1 /TAXON_ID=73025 ORGANISM="Eutreptiella gymnastica-like, Strain CCMP1594" /NCGR_SAMPLE_ID=MMETSP0809 /ASSEMBLY_ACC=CAM_ASM_000658 /LENGTH=96 /DNA_ID=CAMNT_0015379435 /DNA_START=321 /DNA_END=611 /DNA_ORIENTATION=-